MYLSAINSKFELWIPDPQSSEFDRDTYSLALSAACPGPFKAASRLAPDLELHSIRLHSLALLLSRREGRSGRE